MSNSPERYYVGIDVSKEKLDVHGRNFPAFHIPNSEAKIRNRLKGLKKKIGTFQVVCEATGGYEKPLFSACVEEGIAVSVVSPERPRSFANAKGILAKTDAIDAKILTEFGETIKPLPTLPPSPAVSHLSAMVRRRSQIVELLTREKNALEKATDHFVKQDIQAALRSLQRRLESCDKEIAKATSEDAELKNKMERLRQAKGFGKLTAAILLAEVPELGSISDKQASKLVGVAPINQDSGTMRKKRKIRGGRELVRSSLYMPALTAIRFNPILKEFYERLKSRGKPFHVAITAVMRKMVCLANRLLSDSEFKLS